MKIGSKLCFAASVYLAILAALAFSVIIKSPDDVFCWIAVVGCGLSSIAWTVQYYLILKKESKSEAR